MSAVFFLILRFALAVVLYAFLGLALWSIWQDLRWRSQPGASRRPPELVLIEQRAEGAQVYRFSLPEVLIGREPVCDCRLTDKTISSRHAQLSYHHNQWWVVDLDSHNGTFLNQEPVEEPLVITSQDRLRCGQVVLEIRIGENNE
jgi:pSer/pThr/pTyr-binding forkhead associated (FHA) protein